MTISPRDLMNRVVEEAIRRRNERLEEEARVFLAMGYTLDELTIVMHPDCSCEVSPKSALSEEWRDGP